MTDRDKVVFQVTEKQIQVLAENFGVPKEVINEQVLTRVKQRLTEIPVSIQVYWALSDMGLYQKH